MAIALITLRFDLDDVGPKGVRPQEELEREASKLAEGVADGSEGHIINVVVAPTPDDDPITQAKLADAERERQGLWP
jgi:hypothetical protein